MAVEVTHCDSIATIWKYLRLPSPCIEDNYSEVFGSYQTIELNCSLGVNLLPQQYWISLINTSF